jgi:DeoR family glycerol-3-phosphate regulon repressor
MASKDWSSSEGAVFPHPAQRLAGVNHNVGLPEVLDMDTIQTNCNHLHTNLNEPPEHILDSLTPRQADIMVLARQRGRVDVEDLAEHFSVAPQTIRKDLNELCDMRLLNRVHGGAMIGTGVTNVDYEARRMLAEEGKRRIGLRAASLVPNNASIMVNIGTTTEQVAMALRQHTGLMAITNNINVANILRDVPSAEVVITGGIVRHADGGIVGEAAIDTIGQFRVEYAIIGASSIDADGTLLDFDYREVRVSQAIIAHAREIILVADTMKFSRSAPVRIGHLSQVDVFVTDETPPQSIIDICAANGVRLEIAQADQNHQQEQQA